MEKNKLNNPFTVNLGIDRKRRLFEKSLKESARLKRTIPIGELIRQAIDKDLN